MNQTLSEILKCEEAYIRCFCKVKEEEDKVWYTDDLLLDMYDHNFTSLKKEVSDVQLKEWVKFETQQCLENHKNFYKLSVKSLPKEVITSSNGKVGESEIIGIYLCNLEKVKEWKEVKECQVKQITTTDQVEELMELDLIHDRETSGEDFCKRRARRRGQVYLSSAPCDSYILYYQGKPVGNCDLFRNGEVAKIEDFAVIPEYQRRGIGTTLLKNMVYKAQRQGAKVIYLNADEEDTPKEMYVKLGFKKLGEVYDIFWRL